MGQIFTRLCGAKNFSLEEEELQNFNCKNINAQARHSSGHPKEEEEGLESVNHRSEYKQAEPSRVNKCLIEEFHRSKPSAATNTSSVLPSVYSQNMDQKLHLLDSRCLRVNRKSGAATNTGVDYENFMFLLTLIRILEDDRIERFYIAQNVQEVGAFDDLVFFVEYKPLPKDKPLTRLFLVQLKHLSSKSVTLASLTAVSDSGHFNVKKYYNGFKSVMNNIGTFNDVVLNKCQIEDMTFIIYTNTVCDLGDNNCPLDSLCRKLLETGGNASNVFSFNSTDRFKRFHVELKKNNCSITKDLEEQQFLHQLMFFSNQSTIADLQEILKEKLKNYFVEKDGPLEYILHRAVNFINENNGMWLSLDSGVLFNVTINFQGFQVKLNDIRKQWTNPELYRKLIIKHICQEKGSLVSVGKTIKPPVEYYIERKVENDIVDTNILDQQFIIITAPPGMGKSEFFTQTAFKIKNSNPLKYVIREDLMNYTCYLDQVTEQINTLATTDIKKLAKDFLKQIAGVKPGTVDCDMFRCCLEGDNNMVILLDGMDEINPHFYDTVCHIIKAIRAEFHVQLWVSTRTILNDQMKKYFEQEFWTLTEFTLDEAKQFLNKYCGEKFCNLGETEETLCVIPLFCKMIGDIINGSNLKHLVDAIKSKVDLYDKFIEVKFQIYYEKIKVNTSAPATRIEMKKSKEKAIKNFEIVAVLVLFGNDKISELKWNITAECKDVLDTLSEGIEYLGIVSKIQDNKPIFIHQSFAEYFCGRWFARNMERYKEYVDHPENSRYSFPEEVDYFMSSRLNNKNSLFKVILNTEEENELENSLGKYADKFNELDPIGRDVLHYANLVNNYKVSKYILFNGYNLTEKNVAEMDLYRPYITTSICANLLLRWLASNLKKYPQYGPLLGVLLFDFDLENYTFYFLLEHSRSSPLHVAIINQCKEDIYFNEENLNSKDELGLTPLHVATFMADKDTIKLLANHEAQYSRDNKFGVYPHQIIRRRNKEIYYLLKQFYGRFMNEDCLRADIMKEDYVLQGLPLHNAVQRKELRKCLENNTEVNSIRIGLDSKGRSVLHVAAASSCEVIRGKGFAKIKTYFKYTRDDNGYLPHHYANDVSIQDWLKAHGIKSISSCFAPEDLKIHGLDYIDLLNKISYIVKDDLLEQDDCSDLIVNFLIISVMLKLVNEDPSDRFTTSQNMDEFSDLYDVVFRSKYKPPGQDKRLLKQCIALCNHMYKKFYLAYNKLNDEAQQLISVKDDYMETFIDNKINLFKTDSNFLYQQTLEKVASIVHTHVELMWEDEEGHLRDCSGICLEQLETRGGTSRNT